MVLPGGGGESIDAAVLLTQARMPWSTGSLELRDVRIRPSSACIEGGPVATGRGRGGRGWASRSDVPPTTCLPLSRCDTATTWVMTAAAVEVGPVPRRLTSPTELALAGPGSHGRAGRCAAAVVRKCGQYYRLKYTDRTMTAMDPSGHRRARTYGHGLRVSSGGREPDGTVKVHPERRMTGTASCSDRGSCRRRSGGTIALTLALRERSGILCRSGNLPEQHEQAIPFIVGGVDAGPALAQCFLFLH